MKFSSSKKSLLDPDEILADSISAMNAGGTIWEGKIEKPIGRLSSFIFLSVMLIGMGYLIWRAATLQITKGEEFFARSQQNRFLTRSLFPARGIFYDRNHKPIVSNVPSFSIVLEKDVFQSSLITAANLPCVSDEPMAATRNTAYSPRPSTVRCTAPSSPDPSQKLHNTLTLLGSILKKDEKYFSDLGVPAGYALHNMPAKIVLARDVPLDLVAEVSAHLDSLPGIEIIEGYRREYISPHAFSGVLGFTGKVSENDMKANPHYQFEETIGKSGLEQYYDDLLHGIVGKKIIEVDSRGRETRFRMTEASSNGTPLSLTLDGKLQQLTYDLLKNYTNGKKSGSAVIMDVQSGAIRALVSFPGYDSNALSSGISAKDFQKLLDDRLSPLFNRSVAGEFPSGSVIKPLFAAAALQEQIIDPHKKVFTDGYIEIPNPYHPGESSIFKDWKNHGWVNFYDAIANSVDVYFYMIGGGYHDQKGLGIERLKKYATAFGLGSKTGIDLPGEKDGLFPDPSTKTATEPKDPVWRIGDTYNVSIGQGGVQITPLQITSVIAAIANGGMLYQPYLLDAVLDEEGNVADQKHPHMIRVGMIDERYLEETRKGMRQAVTAGTARSLQEVPVAVAAKTGTAETGGKFPHAWFVAFAPYDNPEIAVTVMVEHGGEGSSIAAPITREILKWYFGYHDKTAIDASPTSTPAQLLPYTVSSTPQD